MSSRPYTYKGRRSRAVSFLNKKKVLCFLFSSPPFVFHFFGTVFHSWFSLYLPTCSGFRVQGFGLFTLGFLCICLPIHVFPLCSFFFHFLHFFPFFHTPPLPQPPQTLFTFVVTFVHFCSLLLSLQLLICSCFPLFIFSHFFHFSPLFYSFPHIFFTFHCSCLSVHVSLCSFFSTFFPFSPTFFSTFFFTVSAYLFKHAFTYFHLILYVLCMLCP